jgi:ligand-binding SRPBCC domain-containing protein
VGGDGHTHQWVPLRFNRKSAYFRNLPMPAITLTTQIDAPIETVFDLSRSIDLHVESTYQTNETAIAGCTSGLINLGEEVTWEATHFGIRQQLTTKIVKFDRPHHFRDSMVSGAFRRFDHDHHFQGNNQQTVMRDIFDYTSPLGVLGCVADVLFLKRYMWRLLNKRNQLIKTVAENGNNDRYLLTK